MRCLHVDVYWLGTFQEKKLSHLPKLAGIYLEKKIKVKFDIGIMKITRNLLFYSIKMNKTGIFYKIKIFIDIYLILKTIDKMLRSLWRPI